ncbi:MAG TPA: hypothetical protein VFT74_08710 [Isosphaeraceae bacterium]|nr:hypothetical protein [Isosphaeraceae bacterium]
MSLSSSTSLPLRSARPAPARGPGGRSQRLRWGWVEVVTLSLVLIPALSFVSILNPIRLPLRVVQYGIGLVAWAGVLMTGNVRRLPPFTGRGWVMFTAGWLFLQLFNPMGDLPLAAPAQFLMTLSILSPIFWAPRISTSPARVSQLMRILFLCGFANLIFGYLQFYNPGQVVRDSYIPGRFDPPSIPLVELYQQTGQWQDLMMERPNGQKVFRPFGLSDQPGGAAVAASNCFLIAMLWIIRRGPYWKRGLYGAVALLSMVMLYLCQSRIIYLITLGGLVLLAVSLFLRRDFRSLSVLLTLGLAVFVAALAWVIRNGGEDALKRFEALLDKSASKVYADNRGQFLESTFERIIWEYPLGAGLGHWGMMNHYFGDRQTSLYSEIQVTAWIFDGGIPLLISYSGAILLVIWHVFRLSLRTRDPEFAKTLCTICSMATGTVVCGFSGMPFIAPLGLQFWLILGATIGAAAYQTPARAGVRPGQASGRGRP